jgi:hypothetical protein
VLRFGGVKALTKNLHDEVLKCSLTVEDQALKIPKIKSGLFVDDCFVEPKGKLKIEGDKQKMKAKSSIDKVTGQLFNLECGSEPENTLNVDLGIYQMEDY